MVAILSDCSSTSKSTSHGAAKNATGGDGVDATQGSATSAVDSLHKIGGAGVIELNRTAKRGSSPEFTHAALLPGRGMNTFQLSAYLPGRGQVEVIHSLGIEDAVKLFTSDDPNGNLSFKYGGAILLPFANRIRGKVSKDGQTLTTSIAGHGTQLPANWQGKNKGAEKHAMHGLILNQPADVGAIRESDQEVAVDGLLNAGNFSGHWPGTINVEFHVSLKENIFLLQVDAKNVGTTSTPIGIGWHPYFAIPSGQREQVKLVIPARQRALVNNYDDVFPTGKSEAVKGTAYDFTNAQGKSLGGLFLDDCFFDLNRAEGLPLVAEIVDPAAHYGLRIRSLSPQIKAFQVYAPVDQSFVAFEPQFNLGDPYSKVWQAHHVDTGMVTLKPGESVRYAVQLEVFTP